MIGAQRKNFHTTGLSDVRRVVPEYVLNHDAQCIPRVSGHAGGSCIRSIKAFRERAPYSRVPRATLVLGEGQRFSGFLAFDRPSRRYRVTDVSSLEQHDNGSSATARSETMMCAIGVCWSTSPRRRDGRSQPETIAGFEEHRFDGMDHVRGTSSIRSRPQTVSCAFQTSVAPSQRWPGSAGCIDKPARSFAHCWRSKSTGM